jgi:4-amino-4-deoxy-L-arabinose transferase-like glycosyltransferase
LISSKDSSPDWTRRFWILLVCVFLFRAVFTLFFCSQADLAGDEAYYWDWGRQFDWGYYSKPPMIGWIMGVVGRLTGDTDWGIRLAALLLGTGTLAAFFALTRSLYDARTGFIAAALMLLTPASAGLNLFLTIDAPLLLTWTLALRLFWSAAQSPASWARWLILALVIGFGTLSKQMMLVFPLLMVVFAAVSKEDRVLLKNPRLWIAIVIGVLFLIPVLNWQQKHQWITLEHTAHHFDTKSLDVVDWLTRTLEWPGVQALVYTPVTWLALVMVLWAGMSRWKTMDRRARYLLLFSAPALLIFTLLALRQRINPNWPAVFYVPAFILLAAWFTEHLPFAKGASWQKWSFRVAGAITVVLHLIVPITFLTSLKGHKKLAELRGWKETGAQAGQFLEKVPRPEHTFVMALGHRYGAAQMAFNMPQHPRTYRYEPSGHPMSQYEVWPGPEERIGDDSLIFSLGALPKAVAECFEKTEPMGKVEVPLGDVTRVYQVFLGHRLLTWKKVGTP